MAEVVAIAEGGVLVGWSTGAVVLAAVGGVVVGGALVTAVIWYFLDENQRRSLIKRLKNAIAGWLGLGPQNLPQEYQDLNIEQTLYGFQGDHEAWLRSKRSQLVQRLSEPNMRRLLDELLGMNVINYDEMDHANGINNRAVKTREIIDMVLRKGEQACSVMIGVLHQLDPYLISELQRLDR